MKAKAKTKAKKAPAKKSAKRRNAKRSLRGRWWPEFDAGSGEFLEEPDPAISFPAFARFASQSSRVAGQDGTLSGR